VRASRHPNRRLCTGCRRGGGGGGGGGGGPAQYTADALSASGGCTSKARHSRTAGTGHVRGNPARALALGRWPFSWAVCLTQSDVPPPRIAQGPGQTLCGWKASSGCPSVVIEPPPTRPRRPAPARRHGSEPTGDNIRKEHGRPVTRRCSRGSYGPGRVGPRQPAEAKPREAASQSSAGADWQPVGAALVKTQSWRGGRYRHRRCAETMINLARWCGRARRSLVSRPGRDGNVAGTRGAEHAAGLGAGRPMAWLSLWKVDGSGNGPSRRSDAHVVQRGGRCIGSTRVVGRASAPPPPPNPQHKAAWRKGV